MSGRERWDVFTRDIKVVPEADAFLADIEEVCRRHGLSISHENGHGAFEVVKFDEGTLDWLKDAFWVVR